MKKKTQKKENDFNVQPLGDRVLVKPLEADDEVSPSGIIIPDTAKKEKPERGEVVAVGEGKRMDNGEVLPLRVKKGDVVVFSRYGYDEIKIEEEDYFIVSEGNILAVVK